ncbi:MAG: hypothetical protein DMF93_00235, partial [Acidobacteria bacterium]
MTTRVWYVALAAVLIVYLHNALPYLTTLPRVNVDEPWLMERGFQVMRTGVPAQPMLGLDRAYLLQVGYGYLLAIWMSIFGVELLQARLLAVCLGLGIVAMVAWIGRREVDSAAGLAAALFLAVDSNFLGGVRSARTDIPSVFFVVCALAAYVRGRALARPAWFAVAGASLGLAILCHGNAFWAALVLLAWYLVDYGRRALQVRYGYAFIGGALLTLGPYVAVVASRWHDVQIQIGNFAADRIPGWRPSFLLQQIAQEPQRYRGWYFGLVTASVPDPLLWAFQLAIVVGFGFAVYLSIRRIDVGRRRVDLRRAHQQQGAGVPAAHHDRLRARRGARRQRSDPRAADAARGGDARVHRAVRRRRHGVLREVVLDGAQERARLVRIDGADAARARARRAEV